MESKFCKRNYDKENQHIKQKYESKRSKRKNESCNPHVENKKVCSPIRMKRNNSNDKSYSIILDSHSNIQNNQASEDVLTCEVDKLSANNKVSEAK